MSIVQIAMVFFIMTNPIGNCPTILALLKDYTLREQQKILLRESLFSMLLAIFFLFLGETFLSYLQIQNYALTVGGGILLLIVALNMVFIDHSKDKVDVPKQVPFIVPIATPLVSGAGLLTMMMLYSKQEANQFKIFAAILLAWVGITTVLVSAPYLQLFVGKRGLAALEQLMGMLLSMIAMEMIVKGTALFLTALTAT